jgi:hypothetical protein
MTTTFKSKYGTNGQSIGITITSLANNGQRQSDVIDNGTNLYLDALVSPRIKTGGSGTSASGYVNVYAYGTVDGGSLYSDSASGSDGSITLTSPPNMRLIGVINAVANSTEYNGGPFSVAQAFGGVLPEKWGIVIENKTGGTLDASIGSVKYQGIQQQGV